MHTQPMAMELFEMNPNLVTLIFKTAVNGYFAAEGILVSQTRLAVKTFQLFDMFEWPSYSMYCHDPCKLITN